MEACIFCNLNTDVGYNLILIHILLDSRISYINKWLRNKVVCSILFRALILINKLLEIIAPNLLIPMVLRNGRKTICINLLMVNFTAKILQFPKIKLSLVMEGMFPTWSQKAFMEKGTLLSLSNATLMINLLKIFWDYQPMVLMWPKMPFWISQKWVQVANTVKLLF